MKLQVLCGIVPKIQEFLPSKLFFRTIVIKMVSFHKFDQIINKQRVLMHGHQGWNVRHALCHIYMRYVYKYELFIAFFFCSLL